MKKIFCAALFIGFIAQACMQKETLTKEEVLAAIQQFDIGWKTKKPKTVDSILSASYVYFTQSGGTFSRQNIVETSGSADYKLDSVLRQSFDIKIEGNTAVINTIWTGRGTYFDNPFNDRQRCSITVIKNNGEVKILSEHCTPIK